MNQKDKYIQVLFNLAFLCDCDFAEMIDQVSIYDEEIDLSKIQNIKNKVENYFRDKPESDTFRMLQNGFIDHYETCLRLIE